MVTVAASQRRRSIPYGEMGTDRSGRVYVVCRDCGQKFVSRRSDPLRGVRALHDRHYEAEHAEEPVDLVAAGYGPEPTDDDIEASPALRAFYYGAA